MTLRGGGGGGGSGLSVIMTLTVGKTICESPVTKHEGVMGKNPKSGTSPPHPVMRASAKAGLAIDWLLALIDLRSRTVNWSLLESYL